MATQSRFNLPHVDPPISITHPSSITKSQILKFPPFRTWLKTLAHSLSIQTTSKSHPFYESPYLLASIEIQSVDLFSGNRLGFLKFKGEFKSLDGAHLPGSVFMRGGSVAMLIVLTPSDDANNTSSNPSDTKEEYALLTVQPRVPAASLSFTELPAGMLDDSGTFAGAAAKEIHEETGLEISSDDLIDMTQLASQLDMSLKHNNGDEEENLQAAIYPSPGGSDEFMPIFLARKNLFRADIESLRGKLTGLRDHGERITVKVVRLEDVWKVAFRDGKTLAAMALYQGLKTEGKL